MNPTPHTPHPSEAIPCLLVPHLDTNPYFSPSFHYQRRYTPTTGPFGTEPVALFTEIRTTTLATAHRSMVKKNSRS